MIKFHVYGLPKPQARPRARVIESKSPDGKAHANIYSPSCDWRKQVKAIAEKYAEENKISIDYPCVIDMCFYFRRPKSHYGTGRNSEVLKDSSPKFPIQKKLGDFDNLSKAVCDALVDASLMQDDSLIVDGVARKRYTGLDGFQGVVIKIGAMKKKEKSNA